MMTSNRRPTRPGVTLYRPTPAPRAVNASTVLPAGTRVTQVSEGYSYRDEQEYRRSENEAERLMERWAAHRASGAYSGDFEF